jgi:hypothetical protein
MRFERVADSRSHRKHGAGNLVVDADDGVFRKSVLPLLPYRFVPHVGSLQPRLRARMFDGERTGGRFVYYRAHPKARAALIKR